MLFYNENDDICLKSDEENFKVLKDWDIVELDGKYYTYSYGYFYEGINYGDGDYETNWEKRTHPRHMSILEIDEAFAPPSYKDEILNEVFKYNNSLKEGSYYIMYTIARKIEKALMKWETCVTAKVERMEFEELGEEGVRKVLSLMHEGYKYDVEFTEEPKEYEDRASIFIYWEYEDIE